MKFCTNLKHQLSIGKKNDDDVINYICPQCERIYFVSDKRKKRVKKRFNYMFLTLVVLSIVFFIWQKSDLIQEKFFNVKNEQTTAINTIKTFFDALNNENYYEAYKLTNHAKWNSLDNFKTYLKNWKITEISEFKGKSYYSKYGADTIINVKYSGTVDKSLVNSNRDFDFHLKKYNNDWKIIRLYNPKNPNIDILKKKEVPSSAEDAVRSFLNFLNKKLYIKAHKLTNNPSWGNESKFTSNKGFGCITNVNIYSIKNIEVINDNLEIIYARYFAKDPCNESNTYEFYFYVSNKNDYWKIINAKNEYH
ncbi:hypothetical protein [Flavivirga eckloniae]|uniref:Uncharacterized protein n=1 Tax=Flavivirga eckloniae TaxID=1803846 RepID=A0A2K9PMN7_9FLAO|nr:hypothetical protein [Flavivirga eckloniae]AUP78334.1 hypothetical protein C1H87_06270 [Flavivirga eckloniae]